MKKPKPIIELNYNEEEKCDRCGKEGAMDFNSELLCRDCVANDVFNGYK